MLRVKHYQWNGGTLLLLCLSISSISIGINTAFYGTVVHGEPVKEKPGRNKNLPAKAEDNLLLNHWTIAEQGMFDGHGKVLARNNQQGNQQGNELHLQEGSPATGVRYKREVPRINYEIQCEAMRTDGSDFFYGLTFPVNQHYCSMIVGGWGGTAVGLSNVDGLSAIENSTTQYMEFKNNRWYKIRLRVAEGKVSGWIDAKQIFEVTIKEHTFDIWWEQTPMRPLGIATWNTSAALRNFKILNINLPKKQK